MTFLDEAFGVVHFLKIFFAQHYCKWSIFHLLSLLASKMVSLRCIYRGSCKWKCDPSNFSPLNHRESIRGKPRSLFEKFEKHTLEIFGHTFIWVIFNCLLCQCVYVSVLTFNFCSKIAPNFNHIIWKCLSRITQSSAIYLLLFIVSFCLFYSVCFKKSLHQIDVRSL